MPTGRSRGQAVENVVLAITVLLSMAALLVGLRVVRVTANEVLLIPWMRRPLAWAGGIVLLSALAALLSRRWRGVHGKLFFSGVVFIFLVAVAEVVACLAGFTPAPPHPSLTFWTADDELGFVAAPNCHLRYLSSIGWVDGITDASGYRPVLTAADVADAPEVICLGDSQTFSGEVEDDKTWPEVAARYLLGRGKPCHMLNRGVYGYSGLQSMLHLRRILDKPGNYKAVVYYFCCNDPWENFNEVLPRPVLTPSGDSFAIKPQMRPPLGTISNVRFGFDTALLTAFRTWRFSLSDAAFRNGASANYPGSRGLYSDFVKDPKLQEGMRFVVKGMKEQCDRHHLPLYVSSVPQPFWDTDGPARKEIIALLSLTDVSEDARIYHEGCDKLRQIVTECGGEYIDSRGLLDGMCCRDYAASPLDFHFSAKVNERIGAMIARAIEKNIP